MSAPPKQRPRPGPGRELRRPSPGPARPSGPRPRNSATDGLRGKAMRGGIYLAIREGVGIAIRVLGVFLLTLALGPSDYGVFVSASAVVAVLAVVAQVGSEVYLVRLPEEPSEARYQQVASALLVWSVVMVGVGLAVAQGLTLILPDHRFLLPLDLLVLTMPLNVLWAPAQARIERALRYRAMGLLELTGDITLYAVGITLVLLGAGVWGPIIGYIAWQTLLLVGSWKLSGLRPAWRWNRDEARAMFAFGRSYTFSSLANSAVTLVNPLIVGHFLGSRVVGEIALGTRLVETFNFVGRAIWRLSLVIFGRLSRDHARLGRAVSQVIAAQVVLVAPIYVGFALIAPSLVGPVFGPEWSTALVVFPYLATQGLLNSMSIALVSAAWTLDRPGVAVRATTVSLVLQVAVALALVPHFHAIGYGISALATPLGMVVLHRELRDVLRVDYFVAVPWLVAAVALVFARQIPWWWLAVLPTLALPLLPGVRSQVRSALELVRREIAKRRGGRVVAEVPA